MATSVLKFISKIPCQSDMYTTLVYQTQISRIQTQMSAFDEFIWAFRDGRHKDCLSMAWDMLFQRMLPGATGVPPPRTHEHKKDDSNFGVWNTSVKRKVD